MRLDGLDNGMDAHAMKEVSALNRCGPCSLTRGGPASGSAEASKDHNCDNQKNSRYQEQYPSPPAAGLAGWRDFRFRDRLRSRRKAGRWSGDGFRDTEQQRRSFQFALPKVTDSKPGREFTR